MSTLVAVYGSGPAQGNWLTMAKHAWPNALLVDLQNSKLLNSDQTIPLWVQPFVSGDKQALRQRFFQRLANEYKVQQIIAVGLTAAQLISKLMPGLEIDLLVQKGELDFAYKPSRKRARLLEAIRVSERLWFDDHFEMDKAVAHGSEKPHLLTPVASLPTALWDTRRETPKIAFLYPENWTDAQVRSEIDAILDWCPSGTDRVEVASEALYGHQDLVLNRGFPGTFKYRLGSNPTHVVFLGDSAGHLPVVAAFARSGTSHLFMDGTIRNRALSSRAGIDPHNIARGAALGQRVGTSIDSWEPFVGLESKSKDVLDGVGALEVFSKARALKLPWWYEEGIADPTLKTADVFFTTAAIEDRADGARPQRIRAMSEAFQRSEASMLRLTSNETILRRRTRAFEHLVDAGVQPGLGYGENSTAPMLSTSREIVVPFLRRMMARGLKFGWFVRDIHWLSEESATYANHSVDDVGSLRLSGMRELEEIADLGAVLFAPSKQSGDVFQDLLNNAGHKNTYSWQSLPPGVFVEQLLEPIATTTASTGTLNLVYSGGFGGIYDIEMLIQALKDIDIDWNLDLIVRQSDVPAIELAFSELSRERVTIHHGEFKNWKPKAGKNLGVVLLNSQYGNAAFPFKTISYLEKRIPVLAYEGSPAAEFAEAWGVGVSCEPSVESIKDILQSVAHSEWTEDAQWVEALAENTWDERASSIRSALENGN